MLFPKFICKLQIYFKAMKYPSDSPIQNHYLDSILPHPEFPQQKQFLKNRQFYKPQKFIWNNPHRASQQMYKFYHSYNDQFCKYKEPLLREQEEKDRQDADMQRIHRLIAFRNKAREEFLQKQKNRELLESRLRNGNSNAVRSVRTESGMPLQTKYKSHSVFNNQRLPHNKLAITRQMQHSERIIRIEDAYKTSLTKYDAKNQEIHRLIQQQNEDYQRKIRSDFAVRKDINDGVNIKLSISKYRKGKTSETLTN